MKKEYEVVTEKFLLPIFNLAIFVGDLIIENAEGGFDVYDSGFIRRRFNITTETKDKIKTKKVEPAIKETNKFYPGEEIPMQFSEWMNYYSVRQGEHEWKNKFFDNWQKTVSTETIFDWWLGNAYTT